MAKNKILYTNREYEENRTKTIREESEDKEDECNVPLVGKRIQFEENLLNERGK